MNVAVHLAYHSFFQIHHMLQSYRRDRNTGAQSEHQAGINFQVISGTKKRQGGRYSHLFGHSLNVTALVRPK